MTLIATVWSPEGFAISADGRELYINSGEAKDVQKIFYTPFANETGFAWAWVGCVRVTSTSGHGYDLKEITHRVVASLPEDAYLDDPHSYFTRIANGIYYELPTDLNFLHTTDDELIFVGHLAGKPLWAVIIFQHRKGEFFPPVVLEPEIEPRNFYAFSGSKTICEHMKKTGKLFQPINMPEAISAVHEYAKTCVGSRANTPECRNLGGTIHVATVTKSGFAWVIEPAVSAKKVSSDASKEDQK